MLQLHAVSIDVGSQFRPHTQWFNANTAIFAMFWLFLERTRLTTHTILAIPVPGQQPLTCAGTATTDMYSHCSVYCATFKEWSLSMPSLTTRRMAPIKHDKSCRPSWEGINQHDVTTRRNLTQTAPIASRSDRRSPVGSTGRRSRQCRYLPRLSPTVYGRPTADGRGLIDRDETVVTQWHWWGWMVATRPGPRANYPALRHRSDAG